MNTDDVMKLVRDYRQAVQCNLSGCKLYTEIRSAIDALVKENQQLNEAIFKDKLCAKTVGYIQAISNPAVITERLMKENNALKDEMVGLKDFYAEACDEIKQLRELLFKKWEAEHDQYIFETYNKTKAENVRLTAENESLKRDFEMAKGYTPSVNGNGSAQSGSMMDIESFQKRQIESLKQYMPTQENSL